MRGGGGKCVLFLFLQKARNDERRKGVNEEARRSAVSVLSETKQECLLGALAALGEVEGCPNRNTVNTCLQKKNVKTKKYKSGKVSVPCPIHHKAKLSNPVPCQAAKFKGVSGYGSSVCEQQVVH